MAGDADRQVKELERRAGFAFGHLWQKNAEHLNQTAKKLAILNPAVQIPEYKRRILDLARQVLVRTEHLVKMRESRFAGAAGRLVGLNPLNILERGYSVTFNESDQQVVKDSTALKQGDVIRTKLACGEIISEVKETRS
jgi:exodeoxyribonuclease VII large subunit